MCFQASDSELRLTGKTNYENMATRHFQLRSVRHFESSALKSHQREYSRNNPTNSPTDCGLNRLSVFDRPEILSHSTLASYLPISSTAEELSGYNCLSQLAVDEYDMI